MPGERIDGTALGSLAAGSVLLYAGIKGKSIPGAIQAIVQGKSPATAASVNQIQPSPVTPATANVSGNLGSASGDAVAQDALTYVGHCYVFGGAQRKGNGCWDCSSFCNWVFGHDMGLAIPLLKAGGYDGTQHGPPTMAWFAWPGCVTIGTDPALALPGDLAIWDIHHMGICLGPDQMVSAENPTDGTQISAITGFSSGAFAIRRHKGLIATGTTQAPGTHTAGGRG